MPGFLLILAHLLADFPLQTRKVALHKRNSFGALLWHLLIIFSVSLILNIYFWNYRLLLIIIVLTIIHGIIDLLKIIIEGKSKNNIKLELFFLDQMLHLGLIILFTPYLSDLRPFLPVQKIWWKVIGYYPFLDKLSLSLLVFLISVIAIYLFNFKGSSTIIRSILDKFNVEVEGLNDRKGRVIGYLERILIITFVLINNYSLIGLIFTAKSLIRFKEVQISKSADGFVEYYLIGSLASIFVAIISGLTIIYLKGFLLG